MDNNQQQPVQPPMPQQTPQQQPPMAGGSYGQMPPKKGMSKGMLWGLIGGGIGLVVLIIGIVLAVVLLAGPSKEDYNAAIKIMKDMSASQAASSLNSSSTSEDIKEAMKELVDQADKGFDKLKNSKIMKDSETKEAFDKYKKEYDKVRPSILHMGDAAALYKEYVSNCLNKSRSGLFSAKSSEELKSQFNSTYKDCFDTLGKMKESKSKEVSDFGREYSDYYNNLRSYYAARADKDYSSVKYPRIPTARHPILNITKKISSDLNPAEQKFLRLLRQKTV